MAVDTPARIAILGAGPIGLEAALYARFLGYQVDVYERGEVAAHVHRWGHVRMFSPFGWNRSPLGLAALAAQDEGYSPPTDDAYLSGQEYIQHYLLPLAQSDLLVDSLHERTAVLSVGRNGLVKSDLPGSEHREQWPFRLLLQEAGGRQRSATADVVIDTSGVLSQPLWMGAGGMPACGELSLPEGSEARPWRHIPDVLNADRQRFAGRHTLLVGSGYSAATTAVALAELAEQTEGTRVTWLTRPRPVVEDEEEEDASATDSGTKQEAAGPVAEIAEDRLPQRAALTQKANQLARQQSGPVEWWRETLVEAIEWDAEEECVAVQLQGEHTGRHAFDEVVSLVGYRPDVRLFEPLQVHLCYATEGPIKLAAQLLEHRSTDCLEQPPAGPQVLLNPEPHFYILGAKSYGRNSNFLIRQGLDQIRQLFSIIGDRADLDLYATIDKSSLQ